MADHQMMAQIRAKGGFIAALDQSGGSTPGALRLYGIPDEAYSGDAEMFRLMHEMRTRIMTAPDFTGAKIIGAIEIGHCARIAAGSVVVKPVPHNTTVAGVPAKVIGTAGCPEPSRSMDQMFPHLDA